MYKKGMFMNRHISLVIQSAPLIHGIRGAHIANIKKEEASWIREVYCKNGMDSKILCEKNRKDILLFYRKERLEGHLLQEECLEFLKGYHYESNDFIGLLEQLSIRMRAHIEGKDEFPHEIGVFLEYPMEDIKAFITCKGQDFLFCGYWKVYTNPSKARQIFENYNNAKKEILKQMEILLQES